MKKYEYTNDYSDKIIGDSHEKRYLNEMAKKGWELVCVARDASHKFAYVYYWKREISQ